MAYQIPSAKPVSFTTPDQYVLEGLWFGPEHPQNVIIFLHGLGGSLFSKQDLLLPLVNETTAVFMFNNRGHDVVVNIKKLNSKIKEGYERVEAGSAHEIFTDSIHDIQGAITTAHKRGVKNIFLCGHSTGCQKTVYYLANTSKQKQISGLILLCPVSDYAAINKFIDQKLMKRLQDISKKLIKEEKPYTLLPVEIWPRLQDAQRFLSLYTPDSEEEIFSYSQPEKYPSSLRAVEVPTLIIFAEKDEFRDRSTKQLIKWFEKHCTMNDLTLTSIEGATHNFYGYEKKVDKLIQNWLSKRIKKIK